MSSVPAVKFQSRKPVMSGISTSRATLPRAMSRPGVIHALPPAQPATDGGFSRCWPIAIVDWLKSGTPGHGVHAQVLHHRDHVLDRPLDVRRRSSPAL